MTQWEADKKFVTSTFDFATVVYGHGLVIQFMSPLCIGMWTEVLTVIEE